MKIMQLLKVIRQFNRCSRYESTSTQISGERVDIWLESILPSESFISKNIRNHIHKQQLSNRMTELHLFHETFPDRTLPKLDNSSWLTFFKMHVAEERAQYLLELSNIKRKRDDFNKADDGKLISEINQEKDNRNEMIYAPGFHGLLELQGKTFRKIIDNVYGSRLLSREKLNEPLPKLLVDCRFLNEFSVATQSSFAKQINGLQNVNWKSKNPFNITIANFTPDRQLADIVKRTWHFRYGPDSDPLFQPHPFSPAITSRGLKEVAECNPDSIMYISWKANEFLPDIPPPNVKAVVLCASTDYQPWSSSLSAAQKDSLKAYRIPVQKYLKTEKCQKVTMNLQHSAHILSEYFAGKSLAEAIRTATEIQNKRIKPVDTEISFVEMYRETCESLERELEKKKRHDKWLDKPTQKVRVHRYSREERKSRRETAI